MNYKLKGKRVEFGYTQGELAKELNIALGTYRRYETGVVPIKKDIIDKLLKLFNCKYEDIFKER